MKLIRYCLLAIGSILILTSPSLAFAANKPKVLFAANFKKSTLNPKKWQVVPNGGNISIANGVISLSTGPVETKFPFIQLLKNPFPTNKPFTLSWKMSYPNPNNTGYYYYEDGLVFGEGIQNPNNYCDARSGSPGSIGYTCNAIGGIMQHFVDLYSGGYMLNPVNISNPYGDANWHVYSISCNPNPGGNDLKCTESIDGSLITNWSSGFSPTIIETPYISDLWFGLPGTQSYADNFSPMQIDYIKVTTP